MNTDADAGSTPKKVTTRLRINLKPKKGPKHIFVSPEYGAPPMPVCRQMTVRSLVRGRSVECKECASRVRMIKPWDAYRLRDTEHFMNMYLRRESGMVLALWYGDAEPEAVWDVKSLKRLK